VVSQSDYESLESRDLPVPVPGAERGNLVDSFDEVRGSGRHEALDIPAARGTPVIAVDDGEVKKLFFSVRGGLTVYQFDPSETYCYYYAHLDRYAEGLQEGQFLKRSTRIGYVGTTGDASPDSPHLHFAIFKLGPDKHWWQGTPIDPYPVLTVNR
jgi:peptidoglycan LD-endopeptidase LytH